ncbi:MAG: hypothetical protein ACR2OH_01300 [Microthrixaceae bacterium]
MSEHGTVEATDVTSEEAAETALRDMGLSVLAMDSVGAEEDFHFHEFDTVVYVMSGKAAAEYPDGAVLEAPAGSVAKLPAGTVHRDVPGTAYRGVFGFSMDPSEMTQPLNKPA